MSKKRSTMSRREFLKVAGVAGAAATVAPGLLSACAPKAEERKKLTIFGLTTWSGVVDDMLGAMLTAWGQGAGVETEWSVFQWVQMEQELAAGLQAKVPPDIALLMENNLHYYRAAGNLVDVTDVVDDLAAEGGGLMESARAILEYDNKLWGVPFWNNPWPLYTRKDILEPAGFDVPTTWDELFSISVAVQNPPDLYGYGMSLGANDDTPYNFAPLLWSSGGTFTSEDGKTSMLDSQATVDALNLVKKWWDAGIIPPGTFGWDAGGNNKIYLSAQAVFMSNPPSVYASARANDPELADNTLLAPMIGTTPVDGWSWAIFKDSPNVDLAKRCLREWMRPEAIETLIEQGAYRCPPYKGLYQEEYWKADTVVSQFKEYLDTGRYLVHPAPPSPGAGEMIKAMVIPNMVSALLVEGKTAEEAAAVGHAQLQAILDKYK